MCLLAQDRTWVSWLGVYCLLMERFHSWSRCVYNYTLGNRILSVYKRRMFWQPLGFFENSLRKQLRIPSPLLPLATVRALGHQYSVPSPSGSRIWSPKQRWLIGLFHQWLFWKLPQLLWFLLYQAFCQCVLVETCSPQLGFSRSLMRVRASPWYRQGLTPNLQTNVEF